MPRDDDPANEWTDDVKLDFLRTFFPHADYTLTDSIASGFPEKYPAWCRKHGIPDSNERGGYSFHGKLDDVMSDFTEPEHMWSHYELTDKGRELLKGGSL